MESAGRNRQIPALPERIPNPMNDDPQKKPIGKIVPKTKATDLWQPRKMAATTAGGPVAAAPKRERIRIELPPRPTPG
jgi:hypothetical protein